MDKAHDDNGGGQDLEDAQLHGLERRLNELVTELLAIERSNDGRDGWRDMHFPGLGLNRIPNRRSLEEKASRAEALLERLYSVELAIMQAPAHTLSGLGVKARHAAYVVSHYWDAPHDQIDWEAKAIRMLIEAVCKSTGASLPPCCSSVRQVQQN